MIGEDLVDIVVALVNLVGQSVPVLKRGLLVCTLMMDHLVAENQVLDYRVVQKLVVQQVLRRYQEKLEVDMPAMVRFDDLFGMVLQVVDQHVLVETLLKVDWIHLDLTKQA